jgi:hypothetical protein
VSLLATSAGALAFLLFGGSAAADESSKDKENSFRLTWSAPAGCPSPEEVRSATLRNVVDSKGAKANNNNSNNSPDVLEADARVEKMSVQPSSLSSTSPTEAWRVRLRTRRGGSTGEREIEATTCRGVADATAVILALALVPPGSAPDEPATQKISIEEKPLNNPTTTSSAEKSEPKPPSSSSSSRSDDRPPLLAAGVSVASDTSTLPSPSLGGGLNLAFTPYRFRLEVEGRRFAAQSQAAAGATNAGAEFTMTSIGGRACYQVLRSRRLDASPCVGSDVLFVDAGGFGADSNFDKSTSWATLAGGVLGRAYLTPWFALRAKVEVFTPLSRPTFIVENPVGDPTLVHQPSTTSLSASFGAEVHFL